MEAMIVVNAAWRRLNQSVRTTQGRQSLAMQSTVSRKPWYSILYIQVLIAVLIGITVGNQFPELGKALSL
jgi:hypothetical protein